MNRAVGEQLEGRRWLETERKWKNRVGFNWEGKRVLGKGGQGIVGLWTYIGPDRDTRALKEVVVKQASGSRSRRHVNTGLYREAAALEDLKAAESPHVIKMYRHLYREQGLFTMKLDQGAVHRIFLEFCPGGDLTNFLNEKILTKSDVSEVEMWSIFHCLARGAMVMHMGTEDPSLPRWDKEIVHFDIKPSNVLLTDPTTDNEHKNSPIFKFGDFGLAVNVPPIQNSKYHDEHAFWGTRPFYAPEQRKRYVKNVDFFRPWVTAHGNQLNSFTYGCHTNIWQIGILMWCIKHMRSEPEWQSYYQPDCLNTFQSTLSNRLKIGGLTLGIKKDIEEEEDGSVSKYSIGLNALIKECLLIQHAGRPSPQALFERTKRGLESCHKRTGMSLSPVPGPLAQQPQLSARWFSKDPHPPAVDIFSSPQRSLKISELIKKVAEVKIYKSRFLGVARRGWTSRLNLGGGSSARHDSPLGGMLPLRIPSFLPSAPFNIGAEVAAKIGAGVGAGLGAGLEVVKEQLHAGARRGVIRLAEVINPPAPPREQRYNEWEILSQPKGKKSEKNNPGPPPDAEPLVPMPEIRCIIMAKGMLGGLSHTNIKLNGLYKGTTFLQLKGKLQASGVAIPLENMKISCGRKVFKDTDVLSELGGRTIIRLEAI